MLWVDDEPALRLHADVIADAGVRVGLELSAAELEALRGAAERREAREAALRLLGHRARSREELRRRLVRRGYDAAICEAVLDRLEQSGLVDDAAFAREWVRSKVSRGPVGASALRRGLRAFGVAAETIEETLAEEYDPETAHEAAVTAARSRWEKLQDVDRVKARRRLRDFLVRRGLEGSEVQDVLEQVQGDA